MGHKFSRLVSLFALFLGLSVLLPAETQYSDKDKKKMAEIAQKPEVQKQIDDAWADIRRRDMAYAYNVNTSSRWGQLTPANIAELRDKYGQIYDNPILEQYLNTLGQRLVPKDSPNVYAFRLLLDPVPRAEALSTGTIYVSTGLVSLLDNEAQLSYVLAHEIAHVERKHAYNQVRNEILEGELAKDKEAESQRHRAIFGALAAAAGAGLGAAAGGGGWALGGAAIGAVAGSVAGHFIFRTHNEPTEWSTQFENEADEAGLQYMLNQNYDAREIPHLYARLDSLVARDARVGLGFIGSPERVHERTAQVQSLLTTTYRADLERRLKENGLVGSTPEFSLLMSALKRDNGVVALDYDLFAMSKDNLEEAAKLRSNDPRVHYYLGKVLALTGRTPQDRQEAVSQFMLAIRYDSERGEYPEPHLENALYMISQNEPSTTEQIKKELKTYVALYQREHSGSLPPNMHIIYDYFELVGDKSWYVAPSSVISTKNVEALYVTPVTVAPSTATQDVVNRAISANPASLTNAVSLQTDSPAAQPVHKEVKKAEPAPATPR